MAGGPTPRPGVARGIIHPKCGADEWRLVPRNGKHRYRCLVCFRRHARNYKRKRDLDPAARLFYGAKSRAGETGSPFTITIDDVRKEWPPDARCPALGIPFAWGDNGSPVSGSPTLDRKNNAWGYEPGNIAVISYAANRAKGAMTAQELESIAAWMRRQGLQ